MATAGNYATAILTVVLFLEPYCHCHPIRTSSENKDRVDREYWWHVPCSQGTELTGKTTAAGPGGQLKSWSRMNLQLNLARNHYEKLGLEEIYSEVVGDLEKAYNNDWLPEKQLEWFKEEFKKFENIQGAAPKVLLALHISLQRFAVTLDKLYRHHRRNPEYHQAGSRKRQILKNLCEQLNMLLCEVEQTLITVGGDPPSSPLSETDVIPSDRWVEHADRTAVLIQDWGVLRSYKNFLVDMTSIVKELLESASSAKRRRVKQREHKKKGRKQKRPGSQEVEKSGEKSGEEGGEGGRVRTGGRSGTGGGGGARKRMRGGNSGAGKGKKRGEKKQKQQ